MFSCSVGIVVSNGLCCADPNPNPYPNSHTDTNADPNPNANCGGGIHLEMV